MNMSKLNLNLLIALDALLGEVNVTKAGKKIFITQSAMSVALRQLRELFQDELLRKQGKQLILTPLAAELKLPLSKLMQNITTFVQYRNFDAKTTTRNFVLGVTEYSSYVLLPKLYQYLKDHAPHIKITVEHLVLNTEQLALREHAIDLAIGMLYQTSHLASENLFIDELVCVGRKNHPLLRHKLTLERYLSAEHICFSTQNNTAPYITDIILNNMGLPRNVVLRSPHVVATLYTVINSELLVTLPKRIFSEAAKFLPIKMQKLPFDLPQLNFIQVWHASNTQDDGHQWLRKTVKTLCSNIN